MTNMTEFKLFMNCYEIDPYKDGIFYVDQKTKMATSVRISFKDWILLKND